MLHKVVLTFESVDKILKFRHSNETQSINVMPFIVLYKVFLAFESVPDANPTV